MSEVFESMSSKKMAAIIRGAQKRVVVAVPAIHELTAQAVLDFQQRVDGAVIEIVLDCDAEVMRLGYGAISAIALLRERDILLRQSTGLRVGVLVVDDSGWVFTPTALCVQDEVHSDETPNAVRLSPNEVERVVQRISLQANTEARERLDLGPNTESVDAPPPKLEVGLSEVPERTFKSVSKELKMVPPIPFNVSRQVRVFHPYIQYVDISLRGCAIERKRVHIPPSITDIGAASQIRDRLKTTFDLIERGTEVSSKGLDDELRAIRDAYTKPLGKPWGRVLLRAKRKEFDDAIEEFRKRIVEHEKKVRQELKKHLEDSLDQIVDYYKQIVIDQPPQLLRGQITGDKPTEEQAKNWLKSEISRTFPDSDSVISAMHLDVHFRDVTYETLNEPGFGVALRRAFPLIVWDKPFDEFKAAKEKDHTQTDLVD